MAEDKGPRVLIVDDTVQNIQVLGTVLREQNYQINVAQNGLQALESVEKVRPDLILLDVMMPEMDGFEACKRLKANDQTKDIPIIFLTAKVETEDVVRGFDLGAVDYVTKPFNATELLARVHTHLELQRLRRELEEYNQLLEHKVQVRTAELQVAHKQLQLQVKELEGRDKLGHAQTSCGSIAEGYERILEVMQDVLAIDKARIYREDESGAQLVVVAGLGLSAPGVLQQAEDLEDEPSVDAGSASPVARAYGDGKPHAGEEGEATVPIAYGDHTLGVVSVQGMVSNDYEQGALREVLWRLGREAGILCHALELNKDLEAGDIDVAALLDIEE